MTEHVPPYPIPPGELLRDELEFRNIPIEAMAVRIGMTQESFQRLLDGDFELTGLTADRLEQELEIPAQMWVHLETKYRSELARQAALAEGSRSA